VEAAVPRLFVSYRRDDSAGMAGRIFDRLESQFGRESVFMDIDSMPFGVSFPQYLNDALNKCDALLALIGDRWLEVQQNGKRRLDDPGDFVRIEIETALARGIPVFPVLIGRASMPNTDSLPPSLVRLADRNAANVDTGRDFAHHMDCLIRELEDLHVIAKIPFGSPSSARRKSDEDPKLRGFFAFGANLAKTCWGKIPGSLPEKEQRTLQILILETANRLGIPTTIVSEIESFLDAKISISEARDMAPDLRNLITIYVTQAIGPTQATVFYLGFNVISVSVICEIASIAGESGVAFASPIASMLVEINRDAGRLGFNTDAIRSMCDQLQSSAAQHDFVGIRSKVLAYGSLWEENMIR
jgi:hypothetical protein